jgi:hypothetical protein
MTLITGARIGPYEVTDPLRAGGMGRSIAPATRVSIAPSPVRMIRLDVSERFLREARSIAGLNHPHIWPRHNVCRPAEFAYLVMEFTEG